MSKKIYILISVLGLLTSCGTKNKVPTNPNLNFSTPDLTLYELKANVEQVVVDNYTATFAGGVIKDGELSSSDTIFFNDKGLVYKLITAVPGKYVSVDQFNYTDEGHFENGSRVVRSDYWDYDLTLTLKRNEHGDVTHISGSSPIYDEQGFEDEYKWHEGALVESRSHGAEWSTTNTYVYNPSGRRETMTSQRIEGLDSLSVETKYDYVSFDDCGNWTKRTTTDVTTEHSRVAEDSQSSEKPTTYTVQQRTITYRQ
jgi:hypothetical protein